MRNLFKAFSVALCAPLAIANLSACAGDRSTQYSTLLASPPKAEALSYTESRGEGLTTLRTCAEQFAAKLSSAAYAAYDGNANYTVSPISVYMALSTAAACANGETRDELLSALGVTYGQLESDFSTLYRALTGWCADNNMGKLILSNSIWVQNGFDVDDACIGKLAENFYCHSYAADFARDNRNANLAIKNFVNKQTRGLINQEFELNEETVFTLINTLYLKDTWNIYGDNLPFANGTYQFAEKDGTVKETKLLRGYYCAGRMAEGETYAHFYAVTDHNYKIKFILPKQGYTVDEVFTEETIAEVNAIGDYHAHDHDAKIHYYTRCIFPEFKAGCDVELKGILGSVFGVNCMFGAGCDFSALTDSPVFCASVRHVTKLTVDKKGIEGAAVTVEPFAGAAGPDGYEEVYEDFVVNGAFGFLITDSSNTTLFAGVVGEL